MRYKLVIDYVGTDFHGFQRQVGVKTVQSELEDALEKLTQEKIVVTASGRTDAGVHALGQVISFDTTKDLKEVAFTRGLNNYLPSSIRVRSACVVDDNFSPRFSAISKTYMYKLYKSDTESALKVGREVRFNFEPNIENMKKVALLLQGEHDFATFMSSGSPVVSTVRTIYFINIDYDGTNMTITVKGNGFLYNMVRIIVALLLKVGENKMTLSDARRILECKDRNEFPYTAQAEGLYLFKVEY